MHVYEHSRTVLTEVESGRRFRLEVFKHTAAREVKVQKRRRWRPRFRLVLFKTTWVELQVQASSL